MNTQALRRKVLRAIKIAPETAAVFRPKFNAFGEREGFVKVCGVTGQRYRLRSFFSRSQDVRNTRLGGRVLNWRGERFLAIADGASETVQAGDFLHCQGQSHEIIHVEAKPGVFYDFALEEAAVNLMED